MLYELCTSLRRSQKSAILLGIDLAWIVVAFFLTQLLMFGSLPNGDVILFALPFLWVMLPVATGLTVRLGLHRIKLNAYETKGIIETAGMAGAIGLSGLAINLALGLGQPGHFFIIFSMMYLIFSAASRLILREFVVWVYRNGKSRKRVLIYGAGQTGQQLAMALLADDALKPVAFVDDNPTLQSLTIAGLRVHSPVNIKEFIKTNAIERVILAMPSASHPAQARIARELRKIGCEVHNLPSFAQLVSEREARQRRNLPPSRIYEMLGRNRLETELPGVNETYAGRCILVTGAGGSVGSELCRQLSLCAPSRLIVLDHSELALYDIVRELTALAPEQTIVPVLGSVCRKPLVERVFRDHAVDVVLHAAAYKHLPMVEDNSIEGLRNNVLGTRIVADAALAAGVERFILISTDKAVRPTSTMGASKRLAELIVQDLATRTTTTRFSMVRFGNVLGSSGSVIPLFEDQIARGGPVTVTHSDVTRFFMTISEAVRLVLMAGTFARGGDVFVLDMGKPVSIRQVALQMIEGAGYTLRNAENPQGDIEIAFTGLRPGEKLHEELLIDTDNMLTTPHPKILRAEEKRLSEIEIASAVADLRKAIEAQDPAAARKVLDRWIEPGMPVPQEVSLV